MLTYDSVIIPEECVFFNGLTCNSDDAGAYLRIRPETTQNLAYLVNRPSQTLRQGPSGYVY